MCCEATLRSCEATLRSCEEDAVIVCEPDVADLAALLNAAVVRGGVIFVAMGHGPRDKCMIPVLPRNSSTKGLIW